MRLSGGARVGLRRRHRYIVCDGRRRADFEGACDLRVLGAEGGHRYGYFERETVLQYESEVREWGMCATARERGGGRNAGILRERVTGDGYCDSPVPSCSLGWYKPATAGESQ